MLRMLGVGIVIFLVVATILVAASTVFLIVLASGFLAGIKRGLDG